MLLKRKQKKVRVQVKALDLEQSICKIRLIKTEGVLLTSRRTITAPNDDDDDVCTCRMQTPKQSVDILMIVY